MHIMFHKIARRKPLKTCRHDVLKIAFKNIKHFFPDKRDGAVRAVRERHVQVGAAPVPVLQQTEFGLVPGQQPSAAGQQKSIVQRAEHAETPQQQREPNRHVQGDIYSGALTR